MKYNRFIKNNILITDFHSSIVNKIFTLKASENLLKISLNVENLMGPTYKQEKTLQ